MEYFWWLYLATRLNAIQGVFIAGAIAPLMFVGISLFACSVTYEAWSKNDYWLWLRYKIKWFLIVAGISAIGAALTPNKQDALFIAGGVGVVEGAKALKGSEIAKKSAAVVEQWLANNLTELQHKGKELEGKKK